MKMSSNFDSLRRSATFHDFKYKSSAYRSGVMPASCDNRRIEKSIFAISE